MSQTIAHPSGMYRYLPGGAAFSAGVVTEPGYRLLDWVFADPQPLDAAFERVAAQLRRRGLGAASLVGVELRSVAQFDSDGFAAFNQAYVDRLARYFGRPAGPPPFARTNVVLVEPMVAADSVHAVQVVEPATTDRVDYVVSGLADLRGAVAPENVVAYRDVSPAGLGAKVSFVTGGLRAALADLGVGDDTATSVDVYTARAIEGLEAAVASSLPAVGRHGLHRWLARPPVVDLEFEMSAKRVSARELVD